MLDGIKSSFPLFDVLLAFVLFPWVLEAAARNWSVQLPTDKHQLVLDKAAVQLEGTNKQGKWRRCTVTQVEEVKILTRMRPILLSTIIMNTCLAQLQTLSVQQGTLMDPSLGKFDVPAASIPVIPLVFMSVLIPIYEFLFVPVMRMFTGHPTGITHLQRVGVGLVLSAISMAIAGAVEVKRKNEFNHHNHRTSLFWLSFHYAIFGIADMFGLMDFFYSEAPAGMRSLATSFSFLSLSIGCYLSSAFVELINSNHFKAHFKQARMASRERHEQEPR
ncbi:hypothetical protein CQW23_04086 [Capsicum baccatum]|uniref:Uncharacterized protein n=1 Tax=Capsicum baccatum TaxID=33114 RepID=A0A2G2XDQ7_CAPBA|nr:hypothetical protein CQW23_04086 [Capsicum baccatum]